MRDFVCPIGIQRRRLLINGTNVGTGLLMLAEYRVMVGYSLISTQLITDCRQVTGENLKNERDRLLAWYWSGTGRAKRVTIDLLTTIRTEIQLHHPDAPRAIGLCPEHDRRQASQARLRCPCPSTQARAISIHGLKGPDKGARTLSPQYGCPKSVWITRWIRAWSY